jgi:hypothetical protein
MITLTTDILATVEGGGYCYESGTFGIYGFEFQVRIGDCSLGK